MELAEHDSPEIVVGVSSTASEPAVISVDKGITVSKSVDIGVNMGVTTSAPEPIVEQQSSLHPSKLGHSFRAELPADMGDTLHDRGSVEEGLDLSILPIVKANTFQLDNGQHRAIVTVPDGIDQSHRSIQLVLDVAPMKTVDVTVPNGLLPGDMFVSALPTLTV